MDCDASFDPADLPGVAGPVLAGESDLFLGQRRPTTRGAWPPHARLANRLLALRIRRATGVRLSDLGPMRAARREALLGLGITDRRFGYPLEMVLKAADAGWRIGQTDVPYAPRTGQVEGDRYRRRDAEGGRGHAQGLEGGDRMSTLIIIAKAPVPGQRQDPADSAVHGRGGRRAGRGRAGGHAACGPDTEADLRLLVLEGDPVPRWHRAFTVVPQAPGTLDRRLAAAFAAAAALRDPGPVLLVGMDTPQVTPELAAGGHAHRRRGRHLGCGRGRRLLGLGLAGPGERDLPALLHGVPMSTDHTGADQARRLAGAGLRVRPCRRCATSTPPTTRCTSPAWPRRAGSGRCWKPCGSGSGRRCVPE